MSKRARDDSQGIAEEGSTKRRRTHTGLLQNDRNNVDQIDLINNLPDELLLDILGGKVFDIEELFNATHLTCRRWFQIIVTPSFGRSFCLRRWGQDICAYKYEKEASRKKLLREYYIPLINANCVDWRRYYFIRSLHEQLATPRQSSELSVNNVRRTIEKYFYARATPTNRAGTVIYLLYKIGELDLNHEGWLEAYSLSMQAFREPEMWYGNPALEYREIYTRNCLLLLDLYDTAKSRNRIMLQKKMLENIAKCFWASTCDSYVCYRLYSELLHVFTEEVNDRTVRAFTRALNERNLKLDTLTRVVEAVFNQGDVDIKLRVLTFRIQNNGYLDKTFELVVNFLQQHDTEEELKFLTWLTHTFTSLECTDAKYAGYLSVAMKSSYLDTLPKSTLLSIAITLLKNLTPERASMYSESQFKQFELVNCGGGRERGVGPIFSAVKTKFLWVLVRWPSRTWKSSKNNKNVAAKRSIIKVMSKRIRDDSQDAEEGSSAKRRRTEVYLDQIDVLNNLPNELLFHILCLYFIDEGLSGKAYLTCRKWYQIIFRTQSFHRNCCIQRWGTDLCALKYESIGVDKQALRSEFYIPVIDADHVDWRHYFYIRDLYEKLLPAPCQSELVIENVTNTIKAHYRARIARRCKDAPPSTSGTAIKLLCEVGTLDWRHQGWVIAYFRCKDSCPDPEKWYYSTYLESPEQYTENCWLLYGLYSTVQDNRVLMKQCLLSTIARCFWVSTCNFDLCHRLYYELMRMQTLFKEAPCNKAVKSFTKALELGNLSIDTLTRVVELVFNQGNVKIKLAVLAFKIENNEYIDKIFELVVNYLKKNDTEEELKFLTWLTHTFTSFRRTDECTDAKYSGYLSVAMKSSYLETLPKSTLLTIFITLLDNRTPERALMYSESQLSSLIAML